MAAIYGLTVYTSVLFNTGGNVRRWANSVEREFTGYAIAFAPINKRMSKQYGSPGDLKESISGDVTRVGAHELETVISVGVRYATYVLRGTYGPITPRFADKMNVPDNPGFGFGKQGSVSGQAPNRFMMRAAIATGQTHSSVRGWMPT